MTALPRSPREWSAEALEIAEERACIIWADYGCPEDPEEWEAAKRMAIRITRRWWAAGGDESLLAALAGAGADCANCALRVRSGSLRVARAGRVA